MRIPEVDVMGHVAYKGLKALSFVDRLFDNQLTPSMTELIEFAAKFK